MMEQAFRDLIEFETRCGHPPTDGPPGIPDERTQALRIRLITEEYVELTTALTEGNLPEIADGIADLIYVCIGTAVRLGIALPAVWDAVHCANLTKVIQKTKREPDGKILKQDGFRHPDIAAILANQRPLAETYGTVTAPVCQFCGCEDFKIEATSGRVGDTYSPTWWYAECDACMACGPLSNSKESALDAMRPKKAASVDSKASIDDDPEMDLPRSAMAWPEREGP